LTKTYEVIKKINDLQSVYNEGFIKVFHNKEEGLGAYWTLSMTEYIGADYNQAKDEVIFQFRVDEGKITEEQLAEKLEDLKID